MTKRYNTGTPDRLLDSAEKLFSTKGYDAVTLANIADGANANVGQIVYHFKSKDDLFRACILRRAKVLSDERMTLLKNYIQLVGQKNVQVEPLIRAFIDPFFDKILGGDEGWRNYTKFLARIVWHTNAYDAISEGYDEVAVYFLKNFQQALPSLTDDGAVRGFQLLLSVLYGSISNDKRIENLSRGASRANDYKAYYDHIIPFVTAGLISISTI